MKEFTGYQGLVWKEIRKKVLERDKHKCRICGEYGDCIDHIIPWKDEGNNSLNNLQVLCRSCNVKKEKPDSFRKYIPHTIKIVKCIRCGWEWATKINPKYCPKCKSPYWNKPRIRGK